MNIRVILLSAMALLTTIGCMAQSHNGQGDGQDPIVPTGRLTHFEYVYLSAGKYPIERAKIDLDEGGGYTATYLNKTSDPKFDSLTVKADAEIVAKVQGMILERARKQRMSGEFTRIRSVSYGQKELFTAVFDSGDELKMQGLLHDFKLKPIVEAVHDYVAGQRKNLRLEAYKSLDDNTHWYDGDRRFLCFKDNGRIEIYDDDTFADDSYQFYVNAKTKPMTVIRRSPDNSIALKATVGSRVSHEQMGGYDLLVFCNAQNAVTDVLIRHETKFESEKEEERMERDYMEQLDGIYEHEAGTSVFGPTDYLPKDEYVHGDPGGYKIAPATYEGYGIKEGDNPRDYIIFGEGRIKNNPVPDYIEGPNGERQPTPPGYGGHASIAGPIVWKVKLSAHGLSCEIVHQAEWVDHFPDFPQKFELKRTHSPYPDARGIYEIASRRPLTRPMLKRYPKAALRIMRNEILARHGYTFADAATKNYFSKQPWYEAKGNQNPKLSDIEKLNISLIKTIEAEK
ncbi:MAG: YARHG domain-containing protein [Prevotella sp.]|nr:YARHG domain-containing protein [Prevotella sp.]